MANLNLQFSVKKFGGQEIRSIFYIYFGRYSSPLFPIYLHKESIKIKDNNNNEIEDSYYRIVEAYEDPDRGVNDIAKISLKEISSGEVYVDITGIQERKNRWYQVEKLVHSILDHIIDRGALITSFIPTDFIHPPKKLIFYNGPIVRDPSLTGIPGKEKESELDEESPKNSNSRNKVKEKRSKGPTDNTQLLAEEFKQIKDDHPKWTQNQVAMEYTRLKGGPPIAESTVRNAYRAVKLKWKRGDRVR